MTDRTHWRERARLNVWKITNMKTRITVICHKDGQIQQETKEEYLDWKLGRDVVKTLIISDNQGLHGLIIKPFDNQTVSLP